MSEATPEFSVAVETRVEPIGSMLVNIFTEPSRVFRSLKEKPVWVVPLVIFLIALLASTIFTTPLGVEAQRQRIMDNESLSAEQKQAALDQMEQFSGFAYIGAVIAPIGATVVIVIISGILILMGNVIFGGAARFVQIFAMVCFTEMVSVVSLLIKTPLMLWKHSIDVRTSLAVLLPGSDNKSWAYYLLNTFTDAFVIWQVVLLVIGVGIIYKFNRSRSIMTVVIPAVIIFGLLTVIQKVFAG